MTAGALAKAVTVIAVVVASACSENAASKSVAGPPAVDDPLAAVETNARRVTLCVSAGSPAGRYRFENSSEVSGANGTTAFNQPVNTPYRLEPGECVDALRRISIDDRNATTDPFSSVTVH